MKNRKDKVNIFKINNSFQEMVLTESEEWMNSLLRELHEEVDENDDFFKSVRPSICFKGSLLKKDQGKMGDIAILVGDLNLEYCTYDVSTGKMMLEEMDCPIKAVYLDSEIRDSMGFEEETTYLFNNETHDLFFYDNSIIDIREVLHEYIFLNKNPYPRAD